MSTPAVFDLHAVEKSFGHRQALRGITCEVAAGEFVLLLGNNGAGKSTLLRILSTLMRPSTGQVRFQGQPLHDSGGAARARLGVISHESRFYPDLTAMENLRVFGTLYGVTDLPTILRASLAEVRLDDVPDVPVRGFSSGMLKRLAIARLLLYSPPVLLLDEPYSGLDQTSIALLDAYLRRFRDGGGTTVLVTHQFTGGVGLCTRIILLHQGRLVYNQPESGVTAARCAELLQQFGGGAVTTNAAPATAPPVSMRSNTGPA
ncbi:MAG: heme ABC exporter ATP-binding protein CcmA [Deltaproteobacteria bacterium]|nr:heme ABC exporter ATP-binding protein CcmA [Deltaproteobacteria bacterium]